jgi:adenylate cyclase
MMQRKGMGSLMHYQALPVTLVTLAAFILFVTSRRTRALLLKSIMQTNRAAKLSRYFSPNLANSLAEDEDDRQLAGRRLSAAVIFVDIRGFTALGETMTPEELTSFLSEYRNRLTKPIFSHGGTVDKFIGDAIMAVFGTPLQRPDDASRAVTCALDILDASRHWSEDRERSGSLPVAIGIGVHYGEVFAGALGNEQLLEYTVIGDTVNVAERLEGLSRNVGSPLVVSAALLEAATGARENAAWRRLPPQALKGHRKPVEAFCLATHPTAPEPLLRVGA